MKEYLLFKMESEKEKLEKQEEEKKEKARFKERELNIKEKQVEAILELTKAIGRGREEKKWKCNHYFCCVLEFRLYFVKSLHQVTNVQFLVVETR